MGKRRNLRSKQFASKRKARQEDAEEIIIKMNWFIDGTTSLNYPVFENLLIANEAGFRSLSRFFGRMAREARKIEKSGVEYDQFEDHHRHIDRQFFDQTLSDRMEIKVCILTAANRSNLSKMYGISPAKRRRGSMATHLRTLANDAEKALVRESEKTKK